MNRFTRLLIGIFILPLIALRVNYLMLKALVVTAFEEPRDGG